MGAMTGRMTASKQEERVEDLIMKIFDARSSMEDRRTASVELQDIGYNQDHARGCQFFKTGPSFHCNCGHERAAAWFMK
ncbi:MAG: hypothetical protein Q8P76_01855 [bacterium]|nr:hypothetical protein [bacterium]